MIGLTIVWRDESREPLKATVESVLSEYGFLAVELLEDQLPPNTDHKMLLFPTDLIASVEILEYKEGHEPAGYREESTFRETPEKSRWFSGMGNAGAQET